MTRVLVCIFMASLLAGQASADIVQLWGTAVDEKGNTVFIGKSEQVNGATFVTDFSQSTGTGVFEPFVRIHDTRHKENGQWIANEEGYNSDAAEGFLPFDEKAGKWTHSITLGEVPTLNGSKVFLLDINEDKGGLSELISLNALKVFVGTQTAVATGIGIGNPLQMPTDLSDGGPLGDLVWDLGSDEVQMNYELNMGSGSGDLAVFIPESVFGTHLETEYLSLYSQFGNPPGAYGIDDGFEEWGVKVVPAPAAVLLGFLGLSTAGWRLRRFA